ncbi:hypothetical protein CSC12_4587 [Klebsiella michiganensis]|nr:hypothetical protein CSC12_4587 [Klebsiella michiganensis]
MFDVQRRGERHFIPPRLIVTQKKAPPALATGGAFTGR